MTMHVPQERPISPAPPSVGYNSDEQESQLPDEYYHGRATINDDDFPFESTQCPQFGDGIVSIHYGSPLFPSAI